MEENFLEILMIEDNQADVLLVKEYFKEGKLKNHLHIVNDGVEALEFLKHKGNYKNVPKPDIILLDLHMPKKDGRQVLKEIKADKWLKEIPVVVLTPSEDEIDFLKEENLNADSFVSKPVNTEKFMEVAVSIGLNYHLSLL